MKIFRLVDSKLDPNTYCAKGSTWKDPIPVQVLEINGAFCVVRDLRTGHKWDKQPVHTLRELDS